MFLGRCVALLPTSYPSELSFDPPDCVKVRYVFVTQPSLYGSHRFPSQGTEFFLLFPEGIAP